VQAAVEAFLALASPPFLVSCKGWNRHRKGRKRVVPEKEQQPEAPISAVVSKEGDLLTEGQRRSLGTVLRRLELAVWQMEEMLMQENSPDLTLTHVTTMPDTLQLDALFRLARCLRQNISSLAADYGIPSEEEKQLQTLSAQFTLLWADLEDVRPEHLRSYGAVHPSLQEKLEPQVQRLSRLAVAIANVANGTRDLSTVRSLVEECADTDNPCSGETARHRLDGESLTNEKEE
jgi:hypothetical protein